ncbi:MAG: ribose 5-phosphate isomerase B [Oscillospiraceae bacterium]|jgi:ribose 5-phosphate isomerase B|nr:ribose 5-phosphate isomerase B [Oscillospiraceae bacterium]
MIALGADSAGYQLKEHIKRHLDEKGIVYKDFGAYNEESSDYPLMAEGPCRSVLSGESERAILVCGTGIGISMAANKHKGIRAAVCGDYFSAKYTRLHNDANVLCLGGRVVGMGLALELVDIFLETPFEGGRHARRVGQIHDIENEDGADRQ